MPNLLLTSEHPIMCVPTFGRLDLPTAPANDKNLSLSPWIKPAHKNTQIQVLDSDNLWSVRKGEA